MEYCINGTILLQENEDNSTRDCIVEEMMITEAELRGYKIVHSQFDPDSEPYTRWCEMCIETENSLEEIEEYCKIFKKYFNKEITITMTHTITKIIN